MTATPGEKDYDIYCGATFLETVGWEFPAGTVVDLNDYDGRMEIRAADNTLLIALSTGNGRIAGQPDKKARLFISDDDTRIMTPGKYKYDLLFEAHANGVVTALLAGRVRVHALITQAEP